MTTDPTTEQYGAKVRAARERAGLSLSGARDRLRDSIPHRYVPSIKTLQRIEKGEIPEAKVDGIVIYGLAKLYGCRISELSALVAEEYDSVGDLLASSSPWITTCVGQLDLLSTAA